MKPACLAGISFSMSGLIRMLIIRSSSFNVTERRAIGRQLSGWSGGFNKAMTFLFLKGMAFYSSSCSQCRNFPATIGLFYWCGSGIQSRFHRIRQPCVSALESEPKNFFYWERSAIRRVRFLIVHLANFSCGCLVTRRLWCFDDLLWNWIRVNVASRVYGFCRSS